MIVSESDIDFTFDDTYQVIKYDDSPYYRDLFSSQPDPKAVDFIAASNKRVF